MTSQPFGDSSRSHYGLPAGVGGSLKAITQDVFRCFIYMVKVPNSPSQSPKDWVSGPPTHQWDNIPVFRDVQSRSDPTSLSLLQIVVSKYPPPPPHRLLLIGYAPPCIIGRGCARQLGLSLNRCHLKSVLRENVLPSTYLIWHSYSQYIFHITKLVPYEICTPPVVHIS